MKTKSLAVIMAILMFLFALTFSIALPIYIRLFFYVHVDVMRLDEVSGKSRAQVFEAYDDLLDYLTLDAPFSVGEFKWSESGKSHFEDCKFLFDLDKWLLIGAAVLMLLIFVCVKIFKEGPLRLGGFPPYFWAGVVLLAITAVIIGLGSIDFDVTFNVFHSIFFPGKTNWWFYPDVDEIINVFPQMFFRNCAIFILSGIIAFSTLFIVFGTKVKVKEKKAAKEAERLAENPE